MNVFVNERAIETDAESLFALRDRLKPDADIVICNGFPADTDVPLSDGDRVVLIRRGEIPPVEELEALLMARHTPGVHEKVRNAVVGIAGAGGLGSAVAVALARIGIGALIIADFDIVEPSNLNRQQYFVDQLGRPKVSALADNLKRINPYVRVEPHQVRLTPDNIPAIFAGVDVLVEAFDRADQKAMLLESFRLAFPQKPVVAASGLAGYGPANTVITRRRGENFYLVGDETSAACPGQGLMAPRVGVAAHHQANAVLRLLLGENPEGDVA
ncbi:MAG: sulfur carrier protein ThiS adenylyltransferase ThiF [Deltaproteobacteria bacterium]|nr:MAG: sulfur carrier protein ThiS adenylyltransferase ThiF [Deltaproteobacteria bacterium]